MNQINVGGRILSLERPVVMGILNVTKDSFYDGGAFLDLVKALNQVEKMLDEGAKIIDVGGFSSRPKAPLIGAKEQLLQIEPIIISILERFPDVILSIDTYSSEVVSRIKEYCSFIINDISGFEYDEHLIPALAKHNLPYILMHMRGIPENMQEINQYEDVCFDILEYLAKKIHKLNMSGVHQVMVDPGFGFAKTVDQNFEILKKLNLFNIFELPLVVGLSRKSMIYKTLNTDSKSALNGTTALHMTALMNGARILRVHDVKEAVETIKLWSELAQDVNE